MHIMHLTLGLLAVAAAAATSATGAERFVPTGATIEPSGFATITRAPHAPYPAEPPATQGFIGAENEWYARENGISIDEARKRRSEQEAVRTEFELLVANLRSREAGNFTAPRLVHKPDWAYELYFKRDPEATLAKYTQNPRFVARHARYSREDLEALFKPWGERFTADRISGGWGMDDTYGTIDVMMNVTEAEYRAIAAQKGWEAVPAPIKLGFAAPLPHPPVQPRAKPFLRAFAQEDRSTTIQLLALGTGRIVLHDGCLRLGSSKDSPLVMFHRETGVGIDGQGYLVLTDRATGKSRGRIGEWFAWGGPNGVPEGEADVAELKRQCGGGRIANVGNPDSHAQFRARANVVDGVVAEKRVSRQRAWEMLKRCWARQEAARPDRPPDDNCAR